MSETTSLDLLKSMRAITWGNGKAAMRAGAQCDDNPYPMGTYAYRDWRCGWLCAAYEVYHQHREDA